MSMQAWIDDSGVAGQSPGGLVLAGWIGKAEDWVAFSNDWQKCLDSEPKIRYFKMHEAAHRAKEFARTRISIDSRNQKLRDLARIVQKYDFTAYWYWCIGDMDDNLFKDLPKPLNSYYYWAYQQTILGIAYDLSGRGYTEAAEVIFDEHGKHSPLVKQWYPCIRNSLKNVWQALPLEPSFRDDKKFPPLQAADMLAWMLTRSLRAGGTGDHPFLWLWEEEFSQVKFSSGTQVFDQERMKSVISYYQKFHRDLRC
jgi:hypothetical protein